MNERVRNILAGLEIMRDDLVALSAESWHSTDPRDRAARERVNAFLKVFDPKVTEFERLASDLSTVIQDYTGVRLEDEDGGDVEIAAEEKHALEGVGLLASDLSSSPLANGKPHRLGESFTSTVPYGFVFDGRAFIEFRTWQGLYQVFCQQLADRDPARFAGLDKSGRFWRRGGGSLFSRDQSKLRTPLQVTTEVYAEGNLAANQMRNIMRRLLEVFGLEEAEMKLYLRRGRHGELECVD